MATIRELLPAALQRSQGAKVKVTRMRLSSPSSSSTTRTRLNVRPVQTWIRIRRRFRGRLLRHRTVALTDTLHLSIRGIAHGILRPGPANKSRYTACFDQRSPFTLVRPDPLAMELGGQFAEHGQVRVRLCVPEGALRGGELMQVAMQRLLLRDSGSEQSGHVRTEDVEVVRCIGLGMLVWQSHELGDRWKLGALLGRGYVESLHQATLLLAVLLATRA